MRRKITIIVEDDRQPATNKDWLGDGGLPADNEYDPCRNCPNRGKGACMCALPAMFGPHRIVAGHFEGGEQPAADKGWQACPDVLCGTDPGYSKVNGWLYSRSPGAPLRPCV